MRNYLKQLSLPIGAPRHAVEEALGQTSNDESVLTHDHRSDAVALLNNTRHYATYIRNAALYERLFIASDCLNHAPAEDTNKWQNRLSGFSTQEKI